MFRSVLLVLFATSIALSATAQADEHTAKKNCAGCGSPKTAAKHTGVLKKLFSPRPASSSGSWNHTHPKWRADRKVTGAAYQK
jgi:hypothetical protein